MTFGKLQTNLSAEVAENSSGLPSGLGEKPLVFPPCRGTQGGNKKKGEPRLVGPLLSVNKKYAAGSVEIPLQAPQLFNGRRREGAQMSLQTGTGLSANIYLPLLRDT